VECAIGCNEGRTLQEGPGVFDVVRHKDEKKGKPDIFVI